MNWPPHSKVRKILDATETWRQFNNTLAEYDLCFIDLNDRIKFYDTEEVFNTSTSNKSSILKDAEIATKNERDWESIFQEIDLTIPNDISTAFRRLMSSEPPYYYERFFSEACNRVQVGKEAIFVQAVSNVTDFNLYHFRGFLEQFPENWKIRISIKMALAQTIKAFCRRYCNEITKSRYYETLPIELACQLSSIQENEYIDEVITAISEIPEVIGPSRFFTLAGLLAPKLTTQEALDALSFSLDQLDPMLKESDGDGPWSDKLKPQVDIEGAIAGYIWSSLASPYASMRWQAAHVVRALCILGCERVIDHLIAFSSGNSINNFYDKDLFFYEMHARQWLLIGIARGAKERPDIVVKHTDS